MSAVRVRINDWLLQITKHLIVEYMIDDWDFLRYESPQASAARFVRCSLSHSIIHSFNSLDFNVAFVFNLQVSGINTCSTKWSSTVNVSIFKRIQKWFLSFFFNISNHVVKGMECMWTRSSKQYSHSWIRIHYACVMFCWTLFQVCEKCSMLTDSCVDAFNLVCCFLFVIYISQRDIYRNNAFFTIRLEKFKRREDHTCYRHWEESLPRIVNKPRQLFLSGKYPMHT
jgi:hypothetical protein